MAYALYKKILLAEPCNTQCMCLLALINKERGDYSGAINLLNQALQLSPNNTSILTEIGLCFKALKEYSKAKFYYGEVLKFDEDNIDAICNLANIFLLEQNFHNAEYFYKKALLASPNNKKILFNLGTLFLKSLEPEKSVPYFKKALAIDPDYVSAINSLGVAQLDTGKTEFAKRSFKSAIERDPNFTEALFNLHAIFVDEGNLKEALSLLYQASSVDPSNNIFKFFIKLITEYGHKNDPLIRKTEINLSTFEDLSADLESWIFIKKSGNNPTLFGTDKSMIKFAIDHALIDGLTMEFGVYNGKSIRHIASLTSDLVHGFDSFEGIPEPWHDEPAGSYSAQGKLPMVPSNVRLYKGWFDETIPPFLEAHSGDIKFINVDCDLYSSTKTIFDLISDRIVSGTIILFDEFIGYPTWKEDEFKAFHEAVTRYEWNYKILCFSFVTKQVAIKITHTSELRTC